MVNISLEYHKLVQTVCKKNKILLMIIIIFLYQFMFFIHLSFVLKIK